MPSHLILKTCDHQSLPELLEDAVAEELLQELHPDWRLSDDMTCLARVFSFDYPDQVSRFINAVSWVSKCDDYAPQVVMSGYQCIIRLQTNSLNGVTECDFIYASSIDLLFELRAC